MLNRGRLARLICIASLAIVILAAMYVARIQYATPRRPLELDIHEWLMQFPIAEMEFSRSKHKHDITPEQYWLSEGSAFPAPAIANFCKHASHAAPIALGPQSIRALTALCPPEFARDLSRSHLESPYSLMRTESAESLMEVGESIDIPILLDMAVCDDFDNVRANAYLAAFRIYERELSDMDQATAASVRESIRQSLDWSNQYDQVLGVRYVLSHLVPKALQ